MREKFAYIGFVFSILFILNIANAAFVQNCSQGINATELAYIYLVGSPRSIGPEFQEKYGKPITNTFAIPFNWPNPDRAHWARVCVGMRINVGSVTESFDIKFEKDGNYVQEVPQELTAAYGIAIEPPEGEDQPEPGEEEKEEIDKGDWIGEGGNFDSPPVKYVSEDFIKELCNEGQQMYLHSNYGVNKPCDVQGKPAVITGRNPMQIMKFKTTEESFSSIPSTYKSENGFDAYTVPLGGFREQAYAGIQVFKTGKSVACSIFCNTINLSSQTGIHRGIRVNVNKKVENGKVIYEISGKEAVIKARENCEIQGNKPRLVCFQGSSYYVYVDKIFFPRRGKAYKAAWLISAYPDNISSNILFSIPIAVNADMNAGNAPEVDFNYELSSVSGEEIEVKFNAIANDPDGKIKQYRWDFGDGEFSYEKDVLHGFIPGTYSVTLTVRDDSGLESRKTKVLILGSETNVIKIDAFSGEGKGKLKVYCSIGKTTTISIIKINQNLEEEGIIKDAMKVNCNEEVEIPLEKGYYMVKPTFAEEPRAYFSVN